MSVNPKLFLLIINNKEGLILLHLAWNLGKKIFLAVLELDFGTQRTLLRGARGRVVALAKKRRLWRRSTLLCSPSSERRWQLHLPKTVQKCNCLVNAGHNSCQRPWKTTIRENTLRKKLFIQFIKGWVAKSYANLDWQSIANLFAAASCRSHTHSHFLLIWLW